MNATRPLLFGAAVLFASCSQARPVADVGAASAWPMYQGSPSHNAVVARQGFRVKWLYDTGAKINGGLALAGNTIFVDTFGDDLIALDVRTGKPVWRSHQHNELMSTPVVAGGVVYVGSGRDGFLKSRRRHRPVIDSAVGHVWGVRQGDAFVALDASTGAPRWRYATVGQDMPSPALADGMLVFTNGDGHAYALDAATGKLRWKRQLTGISTMASAASDGRRVFVSTCHYRYEPTPCETDALDAASGKLFWRAPYGNADAAPAYAGGSVFASGFIRQKRSLSGRGIVACIDARTGKPRWVYTTPAPGLLTSVGSGEVAVAGTYANATYYQAIPSQDELLAFDARSGRIRWIRKSMGPIKMSPIVSNGKLYVGDTAGVLYVLNASTGAILNLTPSRQPFSTAPPLLVGNTLVFVNGQTVFAAPVDKLPIKGGL